MQPGQNKIAPKILVFKDLVTGERWTHGINDWFLVYCNFNSEIHPTQLRVNQVMLVKDINGHPISISCIKGEPQWRN